jgi:ribosomal protein S18 acetylase RimI-like enzyme
MRPGDVPAVVRLWRRSRTAAQPWLEERMGHTPEDDLAFFNGHIARDNDVWVAVDPSLVVGFLAVKGAQLNYLYVDPPAQKRGIGTLLMDKARALSPAGLTLYTHQRNAGARAFYERRGFRAVAFGVSPPPESEPDVRYEWKPR